MKVPQGLPRSFYFKKAKVIADIQYDFRANVSPTNPKFPSIIRIAEVQLHEKLYKPLIPQHLLLDRPVTSCCCRKHGTVQISTSFEKNAYTPLETARIVTEINNADCNVNIISLKCQLVQLLDLTNLEGRISLSSPITSVDFGKIKARTGNVVIKEGLQIPALKQPNDGEKNVSVTPVNSMFVKVNYALKIKCQMDINLCCAKNPHQQLPIQIYTEDTLPKPTPAVPANGQSQVMPVANIVIPDPPMKISGNLNSSNQSANQKEVPSEPDHNMVQLNPPPALSLKIRFNSIANCLISIEKQSISYQYDEYDVLMVVVLNSFLLFFQFKRN